MLNWLYIAQVPIIGFMIAGTRLVRKSPSKSWFFSSAAIVLINVSTSCAVYAEEGRGSWLAILGSLFPTFVLAAYLIAGWRPTLGLPFSRALSLSVLLTALAVLIMAFSPIYYDNGLYDTVHGHLVHGDKVAAMYFSAVTITTLGYGDLVPATNVGRIAASAEAIFGYIMLGLMIASMVSLFRDRS